MGDPCGVGPEVIVKAFASGKLYERCIPVVIGDRLALQRAIDLLKAEIEIRPVESPSDFGVPQQPGIVSLFSPVELSREDIAYGNPSRAACLAVSQYIETAVRLALDGRIKAVCTCPLHKANLQRHGFAFPGHTEFLKELTGAEDVVMMLAGPRLRVSLVTIHNALAETPRLLTRDLLARTIRITGEALVRDFDLNPVRLAVAGLNPHAGEEGRFGREEIELIRPVVESFAGESYAVSGPFPPDTVFNRAFQGEFDAVVAMYHDQGLIPVKLVHFQDAVNVSLGLPVIRTSVDHGVAYDIAGTGRASAGSLEAALDLAATMSRNREASERRKV